MTAARGPRMLSADDSALPQDSQPHLRSIADIASFTTAACPVVSADFVLNRGASDCASNQPAFAAYEYQLAANWLPIRAHICENVALLGNGHMLYKNGLIEETAPLHGDHSARLASSLGRPGLRLPEDRVWIMAANASSNNYWHWTMQSLPAILHAIQVAKQAFPGRKLGLLVRPMAPFRRRALALAGLDHLLLHEVMPKQRVFLKTVIFSEHLSGRGLFAPTEQRLRLRRRYLRALNIADTARRDRKIYISRADSSNRPLENEADLCAHLAQKGFEIINPGAMHLRQQAETFACARLIVGPHGAGLANLIFCKPRVKMLELSQASYPNAAQMAVLRLGGGRGWIDVFADSADSATTGDADMAAQAQARSGWQVDLAKVDATLALMKKA
ncbi:MAG: hypothetical protein COA47_05525 [Robiginitomaculum sp.]|nr:MAG: hypothetical protein COA47_05525 [Robiginitomaculum sp.]